MVSILIIYNSKIWRTGKKILGLLQLQALLSTNKKLPFSIYICICMYKANKGVVVVSNKPPVFCIRAFIVIECLFWITRILVFIAAFLSCCCSRCKL